MTLMVSIYRNDELKEYAVFCRDLDPAVNSNFQLHPQTGKWFDRRWPCKQFEPFAPVKNKGQGENVMFSLCSLYNNLGYQKVTVKHEVDFFDSGNEETV
jgi:hypothetical protein